MSSTKPGPGRPKKPGEHKPFTLRMPAKLHKEIKRHAVDKERPMNDILNEVIAEWWQKRKDRRKKRRAKKATRSP